MAGASSWFWCHWEGDSDQYPTPTDRIYLRATAPHDDQLKEGRPRIPAHLIAVIDDDPPTTELISDILTSEGYRVVTCATQAEAVSIIQREKPNLVLLDLWLDTPTGGWTILAELVRDPATATIPVIICTALPSTQAQPPVELALLPAAILHKPFALDGLLSAVETAPCIIVLLSVLSRPTQPQRHAGANRVCWEPMWCS